MAFAFGQRYFAFALQLGTSIILARLLTPAETGIFSLAATAVAIAAIVREFGISDYIISQKDTTPQMLRAAFTVSLLVAWSLAAVIAIAAYPLSWAYKEPGVATVMHILALNFMLLPIGSTASALLLKSMSFDKGFVIQTMSAVAGAATTLLCAWSGLSYASPAWGSVAAILTSVVLMLMIQSNALLLRPSFKDIGQVLKFGSQSTLARIADGLSTRADDFIVSGLLGFHSSGILSKANSLNGGFYTFFASAIVSVSAPLMAQARHQGRDMLAAGARITQLMSVVQWMFFATMGLCAHEIIFLLFGSTWLEAAPILQIGAFQGLFYAPFMLCIPMLTAHGAMGVQMRVSMIFGVVMVGLLVVGAMHSLIATAAGAALAHVLRLMLLARATERVCNVSLREMVLPLRGSAFVALAGASAVAATRYAGVLLGWHVAAVLAAAIAAGATCCLAAAAATRHPLTQELRRLAQRRAASP
jgi:O-antigen/teichoic acid export membrane protein